MLITQRESDLLRNLLHHGGVATSSLIAEFLAIPIQEARAIAKNLVDRGWLVLLPLKILRGNTLYYQISRRSARYFDVPNAAAARYTRRDESCLQGLVRFWFRATYSQGQFCSGIEEVRKVFSRHDLELPFHQHRYISETVIVNHSEICIYAVPALDHVLTDFVKSIFMRYSTMISKVKIGFVIEEKRSDQLEKILDMFCQSAFKNESVNDVAKLQEDIKNAQSDFERVQLQYQLQQIHDNEETGLDNFLSETIIHDLY